MSECDLEAMKMRRHWVGGGGLSRAVKQEMERCGVEMCAGLDGVRMGSGVGPLWRRS